MVGAAIFIQNVPSSSSVAAAAPTPLFGFSSHLGHQILSLFKINLFILNVLLMNLFILKG